MACCSPFTAVTGTTAPDPSRHVNYTNGMILGADDYAQEFAYHAARAQWLVRDLLGYGTLSGLAVDAEPDGDNGPRIRVAPGSAAAPSGQLICVGREQCASVNAWLATPEITAQVTALAAAGPAPDQAGLTVYLTLCYTDCAVAPVPIPGEPCRSAEDLMRPSRIADDYVLALGFSPPAMTEPDALAVLDSFVVAITADASEPDTPNALATQLARAAIQLRLALGFTTPTPPTAADLLPLTIHPGRRAALTAGIRALWITRLRPLVQAQRCAAPRTATNDCVLLAVLTFPVVNPGIWQVRPGAAPTNTNITIDEASRPLLLGANAAQHPAAAAFAAATPITPLAFLTAAGNAPFDAGTIVIAGAAELRLPGATAATAGRRFTIRNAGTAIAALTAPASTSIGGQNPRDLAPGAALALVSDGSRNWQVTAQTAGRD